MSLEFVAKKGFTTPLNASITGSLTVLGSTILRGTTGSFTGSLTGNADTATTASRAITASALPKGAEIDNPVLVWDAQNGNVVGLTRFPSNGVNFFWQSGSDASVSIMRTIGSQSIWSGIQSFFTASGYWQGTSSWAENTNTTSFVTASNVVGIIASSSFAKTSYTASYAQPYFKVQDPNLSPTASSVAIGSGSVYLKLMQSQATGEDHGIIWNGLGDVGGVQGRIGGWAGWSVADDTTILVSCQNLRFENGWYTGLRPGYISIGNEDAGGTIYINRHPQPAITASHVGTGMPLQFPVLQYDEKGNAYSAGPGIQSHGISGLTSSNPPTVINGDANGGWYDGELWFYSLVPGGVTTPGSSGPWDSPNSDGLYGHWMGRMTPKGWHLKGNQIRQRSIPEISASAFTIDDSSHIFDIQLHSSSFQLSSSNWSGSIDTTEKRIVFLHANGATRSLAFPNDWKLSTPYGSFSTTFPSTLPPFQGLRMRVENISYNTASSGKIVNFEVFDDTPITDTDVTNFTAYSTSSFNTTQTNALNKFVTDLKQYNLWTKFDCIYPFVKTQSGNVSASMAYNLKSNTFKISWVSTGAWVFDDNGVSGSGATGTSGDTGYIPSTGGSQLFAQDSCSVVAYIGSQTALTFGGFVGSAGSIGGIGAYVGVGNASNTLLRRGFNNALSSNNGVFTSDWRGLLVARRTNSATMLFGLNGGVEVNDGTSTTGLPNRSFMILNVNDGAADFPSNANLRLVMIGGLLSSTDVTNLNTIVKRFQETLGRRAVLY